LTESAARLGDLRVLVRLHARHADRADDRTAGHDRHPPSATLAPNVSTRSPMPPPAMASSNTFVGRRNSAAVLAFGLGNADRRQLRVVEPMQHHQIGAGIDDRDGDGPAILGGFGFCCGHRLLRSRQCDRRAVGRAGWSDLLSHDVHIS